MKPDEKQTSTMTQLQTVTTMNGNDSSGSLSNLNGQNILSTKNNKMKTRIIRLHRDGNSPLGFSIRGGWEHGTGIFVSEVHRGSEAEKQGLQAGDQIVRINGFTLKHAIHDEVISLIKSSSKVILKVKSAGVIPVKDSLHDVLTWKLIDSSTSSLVPSSNSVSPCHSRSESSSPNWTPSSHSDNEHDPLEAKIFIDLSDGSPLGCSVVRGPASDHLGGYGIYVQNVKQDSIADLSGLQVGDQIIDCNGVNFSKLEFDDAIAQLKSQSTMAITIKKGAGNHLFNQLAAQQVTGERCHVKAVVHQNIRTMICSSSSNSSACSSINGCLINHHSDNINSDNDYSICEMDAHEDAKLLIERVKKEEGRLAIERQKIEAEQLRLKKEMEKLELEKKQLERRKLTEECQSLSNCSIGSVPSSVGSGTAGSGSDTSKTLSFLDEIKNGTTKLRKTQTQNPQIKTFENKTPNGINGKKVINGDAMHKQHELLMEEFRRAHQRMFGNSNEFNVKEKLHESRSLPATSLSSSSSSSSPSTSSPKELTNSSPVQVVKSDVQVVKSPPPVPSKNTKNHGIIVTIGTYQSNTNRFAPANLNYRSVIQVKKD